MADVSKDEDARMGELMQSVSGRGVYLVYALNAPQWPDMKVWFGLDRTLCENRGMVADKGLTPLGREVQAFLRKAVEKHRNGVLLRSFERIAVKNILYHESVAEL